MTAGIATDPLEQSIERLIKTGRFASKEDVLREGVRLIEAEDEQWADLDAQVFHGLEQADSGKVKPAEEVFDRLIEKYKAMSRVT